VTNLIAHTEPGHTYPAYLSVNDREGNVVEITVRTRGAQNGSTMQLTRDEWFRLVARAAAQQGLIPSEGELS